MNDIVRNRSGLSDKPCEEDFGPEQGIVLRKRSYSDDTLDVNEGGLLGATMSLRVAKSLANKQSQQEKQAVIRNGRKDQHLHQEETPMDLIMRKMNQLDGQEFTVESIQNMF